MESLLRTILVLVCMVPVPVTAAIRVSSVTELVSAVNNTQHGGDRTILLEDGVYALAGHYLRISVEGVSLRSVSGKRGAVVLDGGYQTTEILQIVASNVSISDMTLKRPRDHAVHVMGGAASDVRNTLLENIRIIDPGEQAIKINPANGHAAHLGMIRDSLIEMTSAGRSFVENDTSNGHPCYTGGVDAHGATGWTVQDNLIRGFWCRTGLSEHGIHFWSDSSDTLVQRNQIVDCDRGIGFGLGSRGHTGGVIRNNMITQIDGHGYSDVGIGLESATAARVYNNSIYLGHDYPNAIEYRFGASRDLQIANNLSNRAVRTRDGATAEQLSHNISSAQSNWFTALQEGDLHLQNRQPEAVDSGLFIADLTEDFDRQPRPEGGGIDIGADEFGLLPGSGSASTGLPWVLRLLLL